MSADRLGAIAAAGRRVLASRPSGLFADIDGTLSPIAPSPAAAVVSDTIRSALARLAEQLDLVVAVTGRTVDGARQLVGLDQIGYVGNHGIERWQGGVARVHPIAEPFVPIVASTLRGLAAAIRLPGLVFEDKGATASIHYRLAPDPDAARSAVLAAIAGTPEAADLRVTEGRMVVNLLPPVRLDKGEALAELVGEHGLRGVVFLGDDVTDLDAFRALRTLREERGLATLGIAVLSPEAPAGLREAADATVDSVAEVALLLETLAV